MIYRTKISITYWVQFFENFTMWWIQNSLCNITNHVFKSVQEVIKSDEWELCFHMSVPLLCEDTMSVN